MDVCIFWFSKEQICAVRVTENHWCGTVPAFPTNTLIKIYILSRFHCSKLQHINKDTYGLPGDLCSQMHTQHRSGPHKYNVLGLITGRWSTVVCLHGRQHLQGEATCHVSKWCMGVVQVREAQHIEAALNFLHMLTDHVEQQSLLGPECFLCNKYKHCQISWFILVYWSLKILTFLLCWLKCFVWTHTTFTWIICAINLNALWNLSMGISNWIFNENYALF